MTIISQPSDAKRLRPVDRLVLVITPAVARAALELLEVDAHGFDEVDRKLLLTIIDKFGGGPVGVNALAASISEEPDAIDESSAWMIVSILLISVFVATRISVFALSLTERLAEVGSNTWRFVTICAAEA